MRPSAALSATGSSTEGRRLAAFCVILAGGSGTRLWPIARAARPKQFLPLFNGRSLFQLTLERARSLVGSKRILVVAGARHRSWIRSQGRGVPGGQIIFEEEGRNTAASILLAALRIRALHRDGVMIVLPSDHWIGSLGRFRDLVRKAVDQARSRGDLFTIGIRPRSADTGFGYIRVGGRASATFRRAVAFVEKPTARKAARLIRTGHLWNSGIFVWRASAILDAIRRHRPRLLPPAERWSRRAGRGRWTVPSRVMRRIESIPIDRAVLERSRKVRVARGEFGWSDLGTWTALADIMGRDRRGNVALGRHIFLDASGCLAAGDGGLSVVVGLKDVIAVRDGTTMLICHKDHSQRVREVAERFATRHRSAR